jgi:hypothetical protein
MCASMLQQTRGSDGAHFYKRITKFGREITSIWNLALIGANGTNRISHTQLRGNQKLVAEHTITLQSGYRSHRTSPKWRSSFEARSKMLSAEPRDRSNWLRTNTNPQLIRQLDITRLTKTTKTPTGAISGSHSRTTGSASK